MTITFFCISLPCIFSHILYFAPGNKIYANYALAAWIFFLSNYRNYCFSLLLEEQPTSPLLVAHKELLRLFSSFLFCVGTILMVSSILQLGVTGTYMGDYFGNLMSERITGACVNMCVNDAPIIE